MSTQIIVSDLLVDISTAQQQFLAGGQTTSDDLLEGMGFGPQDDDQDTNTSDGQAGGQGAGTTDLPIRRYRIRSQSTKVISVQRLS